MASIGHTPTPRWMQMAGELGGVIGRSRRPVCFILGAGCSLSSGAPTTGAVDRALREATAARFDGVELREALHTLPELEKQDILEPLFANVKPGVGYTALAALAKSRTLTVLNLNWDTALAQACQREGTQYEVLDIKKLSRKRPALSGPGLVDIHAHGVIGDECRYGRLETLEFKKSQIDWLLEHGLAYTTVIIGTALVTETDFTTLFNKWAEVSGGRRPSASQWFFMRGPIEESGEDRLRQSNVRAQPLTYIRDPDIDFDTVTTLLVDRAIGTIRSSTAAGR